MENPFSAPPSLSSPITEGPLPVPPPLQDDASVVTAKTSLPPIKPELEEEASFQSPQFSQPGKETVVPVSAPIVNEIGHVKSIDPPSSLDTDSTETDSSDSVFGFGSEGMTTTPAKPKPKPKSLQQPPPPIGTESHHQPNTPASTEGWSDADFDEHDGSELPALCMEEKSCRVCKYFQFDEDSRAEVRFGECRRKAPEGRGKAEWPSVLWDSWCGEWILGVDQNEMMQMVRSAADFDHK